LRCVNIPQSSYKTNPSPLKSSNVLTCGQSICLSSAPGPGNHKSFCL
jgi:hypothetical protein